MTEQTQERLYTIHNSEKCFRFKEEAFENHAPRHKGIYELVSFDQNQNPTVLFVGAAFDKTVKESLEAHHNGTLEPKAADLLKKHGNLYFDYLSEMKNVKTADDAQDVYWWLIQKYKPQYNDLNTKNSGRPGEIKVTEHE